MKLLDGFFLDYRSGILQKRDFEAKIFEFLMPKYKYFGIASGKKDDWMDFLSWLYPRFSKLIDKYREIGSGFEAYICSMIRLALKEYRRTSRYDEIEEVCWHDNAREMAVYDVEAGYEDEMEPENKNTKITNPRQTLVLLLKSYYDVSDSLITKIAPALGLDEGTVCDLLAKLHSERQNKEEMIESLRERVYSQYCRCLIYERRLVNAYDNSLKEQKMRESLARARKRLKNMRRRFDHLRREATNREVAKVLGIPKGTVDSSLHIIRRRREI